MAGEAYKSSRTHIFYGGPTFLAALTSSLAGAGGLSLAGRVVGEPVPLLGSPAVEYDVAKVQHTITVTPLYYTAESKKIEEQHSGIIVVVFEDSGSWAGFHAVSSGPQLSARVSARVRHNVSFVENEPAIDGAPISGNTRVVALNGATPVQNVTADLGERVIVVSTGGGGDVRVGTTDVTAPAGGIADGGTLNAGLVDGTVTAEAGMTGFALIGVPVRVN